MRKVNKSRQNEDIQSPCSRNCCLNEADICLGCFRHIDEITGWSAMTAEQKKLTLFTCQQRRDRKTMR